MHESTYQVIIESYVEVLLEEPQIGASAGTIKAIEGVSPSFVRAAGRQLVDRIKAARATFEKMGSSDDFDQDTAFLFSPDFTEQLNSGHPSALKAATEVHDHVASLVDARQPYKRRTAPRERPMGGGIQVASNKAIRAGIDRARAIAAGKKR